MEQVPQARLELAGVERAEAEVVEEVLALLELVRLKQLRCVQPAPFEEIELARVPEVASPEI